MSQPRALDNIRVVDFSWVRAGPWATRWLGALGAEIIKMFVANSSSFAPMCITSSQGGTPDSPLDSIR